VTQDRRTVHLRLGIGSIVFGLLLGLAGIAPSLGHRRLIHAMLVVITGGFVLSGLGLVRGAGWAAALTRLVCALLLLSGGCMALVFGAAGFYLARHVDASAHGGGWILLLLGTATASVLALPPIALLRALGGHGDR
jgi:hypothetical protein